MPSIVAILILFAVLLVHEGGHALAAVALGVPIKEFVIGFPYPSIKIGKLRLSPFLIMAGVAFDDDIFDKIKAWKKIVIAFAGPAANLIAGTVSMFIIFGLAKGSYLAGVFSSAVVQSIVMLFTGKIPVTELVSPVGVVAMGNTLSNQYILWKELFWLVLSFAIPIFNLLPITALDGGQILMAAVIKVSGNNPKVVSITKNVTMAFFATLALGLILLTIKDILKIF